MHVIEGCLMEGNEILHARNAPIIAYFKSNSVCDQQIGEYSRHARPELVDGLHELIGEAGIPSSAIRGTPSVDGQSYQLAMASSLRGLEHPRLLSPCSPRTGLMLLVMTSRGDSERY
jgi:hypothetical protein